MFLASLQFLDALTQPIGLLWAMQVTAAILLLRKRRWRMATLLLGLAAVLWVIGASGLPYRLLGTLEQPYTGTVLSNVPPGDAVVMLGGTHRSSRYDAFGLDLTPCADRVVMAVELTRLGKAKVLALGGNRYWDGNQDRPDAELLQHWLEAWRVTPASIVTLGMNRNTHDEAVHTRALMKEKGWQRIILVTSAYHMKRAEAVFATEGVPVTCVACDFQVALGQTPPPSSSWGINLVPNLEGFQALGLYLHEKVGWMVYQARGWIASDWSERRERAAAPVRRPPEISDEGGGKK